MCLRAARRTAAVLLVATTLVATGYTAWASPGDNSGRSHRPEIGTAVKMVRNTDGSVTTVSR